MQIRKYFLGVFFTICVAFVSVLISKNISVSALLIAIFLGIVFGFLYKKFREKLDGGVSFSAKKLLRLGIILYGFYITLDEVALAGIWGILACGVCIFTIMFLGLKIGARLGIEKNLCILITIGTAICGAAAILACVAAIRDEKNSFAALGVIVVLGLVGMFLYPIVWEFVLNGFFTQAQMGFFTGLSLHEVANVVGAAGVIGQSAADYGIVSKMIRVMYLAPVLLILVIVLQGGASGTGAKMPIYIPYFAFSFLCVVVLNSFVDFGIIFVEICKFASVLCLSAAMCALGLQIELKSFKNAGGKAFMLGVILSIILIGLAFGITIFLGVLGVI